MGLKRKMNLRKLILGVSAIGMLSLTLTTSTYAWFKISSEAKVEGFDFEVIGGKGFMVSIDGGTYTNDLKTEQIQKAIAVAYGSGRYEIGYETDQDGKITESDVLYAISYDLSGNKKKTKVTNVEATVEKLIREVELLPVTTKNGIKFTDLYNSSVSVSSGRFLEFSVYFKSTSNNEKDNLKYDIYLDGYGGLDNDGNKILPTKFTSSITNVPLNSGMNTFEYYEDEGVTKKRLKNYSAGEKINVYSSNAARISAVTSDLVHHNEHWKLTADEKFIEGKKYYISTINGYEEATVLVDDDVDENTYYEYQAAYDEYVADENTSLIYEINDTENINTNLGSYATNYDEVTTDYTNDYFEYSSKCNAMFTYYNNLKRSAQISPLDYEALPKTIKSLPTDSSDKIKSSDYSPITTVSSGEDAKYVTFRFWLEGWDADCFDGLTKSISVRLALGSKRII